ncbi:Iqg1p [Sporobolomyces salmoneus]|uniref:Iqg1p n=1 Tax=Sporobolomyces salmoneus TaxID=183962 RepID=UPI003174FD7C
MSTMNGSPFLDRSPSLSSDSGASSASSLPPITPALGSISSFASTNGREPLEPVNEFGSSPKTAFPRMAKSSTSSSNGSNSPQIGRSGGPWSRGHKTGAGSASFDAARAAFSNLENGRSSPVIQTTSFNNVKGRRSPSPNKDSPFRTTSPALPPVPSSPTRTGSPTRFSRSPLPTIPSTSSFETTSSGSGATQLPSRPLSMSIGPQSARILSSAIFSSKDRPTSPVIGNADGYPVLDRGMGSMRRPDGRGHRRAMTLPQLGLNGLPVPGGGGGAEVGSEDVPGLPGRVRLSRPAESASPFAPSAVFQSSHGLSRVANGHATPPPPTRSATTLLPSQAVKALDRQRHNMVAYEYLCRLAEARDWLENNITTRREDAPPLWGEEIGEFEQSLRNGYALAHLARSLGSERCQGPIYTDPVRHFRQTQNIAIFFQFLDEVELPDIFRFETVDLYDGKNLPKVVYCIHALSLFLYKQGLTAGMNDLVGRIEFTEDELGATQQGLDKSGVRMPNFAGLNKAMDRHETPPETPEQRQQRELAAATEGVIGLQAVSRGALSRKRFAKMLHHHRKLERQRLQAEEEERQRIIMEEERRRQEEEAERRRVAEAEERRRIEDERLRREEEERRRRAEEEAERRRIEQETRRRLAEEEAQRLREEEEARLAAEEEERQYQASVREAARTLAGFQAIARGALGRRQFFHKVDSVAHHEPAVVGFQASARAHLARKRLYGQTVQLQEALPDVAGFQATCRGFLARKRFSERLDRFKSCSSFIVGVQATIRGKLASQSYAARAQHLRRTEVVRSVGGLQSLARAALVRRRIDTQRQALDFVQPDVVGIQAQTRGYVGRMNFLAWRENLYRNEDVVVELQSFIRGAVARRRYFEMHRHFHENLSQVVRLQAAIRSRRQGSQYRQLRMGTNVPVSTIKNFMRLLDDSEFDYRGELQVESLRKELVEAIHRTTTLEDDVKDLDTKIALLVKNKITHEVARAQRAGSGGLAPLKRNSLLTAAGDPFAPSDLDRQSQRKLQLYQQLFWHLQTKPAYLARLFANVGRLNISEKTQKSIESTTLVVFAYAQAHREEYLLLKLFQRSIQEELAYLPTVYAFVQGSFTFLRLLAHYGQGVNQKTYLSETLGANVKSIISRPKLDLSTDPLTIYRSEISKEEMATGVPSRRPKDVDYKEAIVDKATQAEFIKHLMALRQVTESFLNALFSSTQRMPFGIRYIAREVYRSVKARFPQEAETTVIRVAGHIVYYRFIQPAIVTPDVFGIVEEVVPAVQRHNLAEVCKLLNQISVGRLFEDDQPLKGMNEFVSKSSAAFANWIKDVINVKDAEDHFRADDYVNAAAERRPVIYISPNDIYSTHSIISDNLDVIAPEENDPLRETILELGGAPGDGNSAELSRARAEAITLTLNTRLLPQEDPEAGNRQLFNLAKRRVLAILKVHHGNDLEGVLAQQVTPEDEDTWIRIVEEEEMEEQRQAAAQRKTVIPQPDDIRSLSFHQLKVQTLHDIVQLRQIGLVSKADKYQAILNAIALDIRNKHHRRVQRQAELQSMHASLASLHGKQRYLEDQIKSYHVYIDQSMAGIQKKGKKRIVLPWSMQGSHQRQLEKEGKSYAFGSYKYSAQTLYDRGILLSIDQFSPKQFDKISLTLSSNEIGMFELQVSHLDKPVAGVELKLEDLLESQFEGKQTIAIGSVAKCNLNLLVHLINRKFYA